MADEAHTIFTTDGTKALLVACLDEQQSRIFPTGATVYHGPTEAVTPDDNEGSIASREGATFTGPRFLITGQGESAQVLVLTEPRVQGRGHSPAA